MLISTLSLLSAPPPSPCSGRPNRRCARLLPEQRRRRPSGCGPVQIITLALIFVGSMFATAEVTTVAMTKELGQPGAASLVIGVYAIGSFVVGLVLGALNLRMPLQQQLLIAVSVLAVTALPLLIADTVPLLALAVFVSGIAISPTFITAFGLIERRVPESMLTEGVTWVMTGIGIGMALGAFLAGWVVDNFGAQNGFWVSVAAGAAVVVTIAIGPEDPRRRQARNSRRCAAPGSRIMSERRWRASLARHWTSNKDVLHFSTGHLGKFRDSQNHRHSCACHRSLASPSLWAERSFDPTDVGSLDARHRGEHDGGWGARFVKQRF